MTEEQKEKLTNEIVKKTTDSFQKYTKGFEDVPTCIEAMAAAYLRIEISTRKLAEIGRMDSVVGILSHLKTMEYELFSYYNVNEAEVEAELIRRMKATAPKGANA